MSNIILSLVKGRNLDMRYSDDIIDEIRTNNDIVDVISQYVILKRSGRNFFGLCPFHREKSPSFSVSPDKQIFHCFGCGVGGDVFGFIRKIENIEFKEAIELLAERSNIKLPTSDNKDDNKIQYMKSRLYEIYKIAENFFHENLYKPTAKQAQEYVKKRKMDNATLKKFKIGYSGKFDELYKILKEKGFTEEEMLNSRLVNKSSAGKFNDAFRNRLMFPIRDVKERTIAFGGRALDDSKPKYINSPETLIYSKGRNLYALDIAKNTKEDGIIMVEGYMDAVSLHQRGIDNVVASLGTALTEAQGRLLMKYVSKIIVGYDSDAAGQDATLRGLEILKNIGYDIRVLQMEGAKDPDEFVIKYGSGRFKLVVEKAISLVEFKVKSLKNKYNLENSNDKIIFLNEVSKILSEVDNDIEKEVYIDKIAMQYGISKEAIYAQLNKIIYSSNKGSKILEKNAVKGITIKKEKTENKVEKREKLIIYLLITLKLNVYNKIKSIISVEDFKIDKNKKIVEKLYSQFEKGDIANVLDLFEDDEVINYITYIMSSEVDIENTQKAIDDIINKIQKEKLIEEKNEILKKLIENNLSEDEKKKLEDRIKEVSIELTKIK